MVRYDQYTARCISSCLPEMSDVGGSVQVGVAPGTYQSFILFPKFSCYKLTPTATEGSPVTVSYAVDASAVRDGELYTLNKPLLYREKK